MAFWDRTRMKSLMDNHGVIHLGKVRSAFFKAYPEISLVEANGDWLWFARLYSYDTGATVEERNGKAGDKESAVSRAEEWLKAVLPNYEKQV